MKPDIEPFIPISIRHGWPSEKIVSGALLFADISGFTTMSEKLGSMGKPGTEELTRILNECFDAMLGIIGQFEGDVIRFAGDALLVRFYNPELASAYAREMMQKVARFRKVKTSYGDFTLSMKTVIARGEWNEFVVGTERRAELFLSGMTVKLLAEAEDRAHAGDMIEVKGQRSSLKLEHIQPIHHQITQESFLPEGVLSIAPRGMFGEHRPVACVFVNIRGYDENNPDIAGLRELFNTISDISNQYSASIQLIDNIATEGSKILVLFGAPLSYGDTVKRAVLAGMDICRILSQSPQLKVHVGINQGFAYAGIIGNDWRKVYTVIGDVVNTAARLVTTAAPGQVVVSEDVYRLTNQFIEFDRMRPERVKGKRKQLMRYAPLRSKQEIIHRYGFVGRDKEISQILGAIASGKKVIKIVGEAGIGKSRLLDELNWRLQEEGYTVLRGNTDELKPPFYLFASMIRDEAGIKDNDSTELKKRKIAESIRSLTAHGREQVYADPLYRRIPFIGKMLFELEYPGSIYERLSPQLRLENLYDALRYFIEYHSDPICVMLDDLHWVRKEETDALRFLTRVLTAHLDKTITFILAMRPRAKTVVYDESLAPVLVKLGELDQLSVDQLMLQILDQKPLEKELDTMLREKIEGNPFYVEQFLLYLIQKGLIKQQGTEWVRTEAYSGEALPEDIFAMILSRVDRLEELTKESLRVASTVGIEFRETIIRNILKQSVRAHLAKTIDERLTYLKNAVERKYAFSQVIIKDVIYDSILRKRRKTMHAAVAKTIEDMYRAQLRDYYGVLAYHFDNAENWERSLYYHTRAGEAAKLRYANDTAITHFNRAVWIVESKAKQRNEDMITLWNHLGDIYNIKGEYESAIKSFAAMARYARTDKKAQVTSRRKTAGILENQGLYDSARRILNRAARTIRGKTPEHLAESGEIALLQCSIRRKQGDFQQAIAYGKRTLALVKQLRRAKSGRIARVARAANRLEAEAYLNLGRVFHHKGGYRRAITYFSKALSILKKLHDVRELGIATGNLGTVYKAQGDYTRAIRLLEKSLETAREIGEKRVIAIMSVNLGNIYYARGNYDKTIQFYEESLAISEEIGDKEGVGVVCNNLGFVYKTRGDYAKAQQLFRRNLKFREKMGDKRGISIALISLGEVLEAQNRFAGAKEFYTRSLTLSEEIGDREGIAAAYGSLSMIYKIRKDYTRAIQLLRKDLNIRRQIGDKAGIGEVLRRLGDVYIQKKAFKKAEAVLREGIVILKGVQSKRELTSAYLNLGELLLRTKKKKMAKRSFEKALRLAQETKVQAELAKCYFVCGKIHAAMGEFQKGKKNLQNAIKLFKKLKQLKSLADSYHAYAQLLRQSAKTAAGRRAATLCTRRAQNIYKKL